LVFIDIWNKLDTYLAWVSEFSIVQCMCLLDDSNPRRWKAPEALLLGSPE